MGTHYNSIHVRHTDQRAVTAAVETLLRNNKSGRVLVGPVLNGWVGVYPNDALAAEDSTSTLSASLNTTVLALLLHDSDLVLYNHYHAGNLVDEYSSDPDCFEKVAPAEHERLKGRPELFGALLDSSEKVQALTSLLARGQNKKHVFEDERFEKLALLLGLQNALTSYDYLTQGEAHGITRRKDFVHVPDLTAEKAAAKAAREAVRAELKRLKSSGILAFDLRPKSFMAAVDVAFDPLSGGLLLNLNALYPQAGQKLLQLKPPWTQEPDPVDLGIEAAPGSLTFSNSGKWLAGHDGQLRVWNWSRRTLLTVSGTGMWPVQFSPDETLLLCRSQTGFSVILLQTGGTIQSAPAGITTPKLSLGILKVASSSSVRARTNWELWTFSKARSPKSFTRGGSRIGLHWLPFSQEHSRKLAFLSTELRARRNPLSAALMNHSTSGSVTMDAFCSAPRRAVCASLNGKRFLARKVPHLRPFMQLRLSHWAHHRWKARTGITPISFTTSRSMNPPSGFCSATFKAPYGF